VGPRDLAHIWQKVWGSLTDSICTLGTRSGGGGSALVTSFGPVPARRSDTTNSKQLDHSHKRRSQPVVTNYEGIDERDQTVSRVLYILAESKARGGLCHWIAGRSGESSA
jgi:hypothetical protein